MLTVDNAAQFLIQVLVSTLDHPALHLGQFLIVKWHPCACTVSLDLVLDRLKQFLGESLAFNQDDTFERGKDLDDLVLVESIDILHG